MKKIMMVAGLVMFIAASCNNTAKVTSPTPTPSPVAANSPTPSPTPVPVDSAPVAITSLTPSSGHAGATVTVKGRGFTPTGNEILLGDKPSASHHMDKTPANMIISADSKDGTTLSFTFPSTGMSGIICNVDNHCIGITATQLQPGQQQISISNRYGLSKPAIFTLTK